MAENESPRNEEIQALLVEAIEVQLAAFNASIGFWTEWVQEAARFSEEATRRLGELRSAPAENGQMLLEMTDLTRDSLRSLSHMPRRAAENFIRELDRFEVTRGQDEKGPAKPRPKRSARVKS